MYPSHQLTCKNFDHLKDSEKRSLVRFRRMLLTLQDCFFFLDILFFIDYTLQVLISSLAVELAIAVGTIFNTTGYDTIENT